MFQDRLLAPTGMAKDGAPTDIAKDWEIRNDPNLLDSGASTLTIASQFCLSPNKNGA